METQQVSAKPKPYHTVNGQWPEGTNEGRSLKPTPQEALDAAKKLYTVAMEGKTWSGKWELTSGNRYTWPRYGTFRVNPDQRGGGWHELVHCISHYAARRLYNEGHGPRHRFIERTLIQHVVDNGWLDGALKKEERPKATKTTQMKRIAELARINQRIARWSTKMKRAQTALKKLEASKKRYERLLAN